MVSLRRNRTVTKTNYIFAASLSLFPLYRVLQVSFKSTCSSPQSLQMCSLSSFRFCCWDNTPRQKQLGGERVNFSLQLQVTVYHCEEVKAGTHLAAQVTSHLRAEKDSWARACWLAYTQVNFSSHVQPRIYCLGSGVAHSRLGLPTSAGVSNQDNFSLP